MSASSRAEQAEDSAQTMKTGEVQATALVFGLIFDHGNIMALLSTDPARQQALAPGVVANVCAYCGEQWEQLKVCGVCNEAMYCDQVRVAKRDLK